MYRSWNSAMLSPSFANNGSPIAIKISLQFNHDLLFSFLKIGMRMQNKRSLSIDVS
jgi:hypothetical protein